MQVYLDNAATTPMHPEVIAAMLPVMQDCFGNPSSAHTHGRRAKAYLENARKTIAGLLHAQDSEIIFTSGGTEADNIAIRSSVDDCGVKMVISSVIEHHAVLHPLQELEKLGKIKLEFVRLLPNGQLDVRHLTALLQENSGVLVSLMHSNNEIGSMIDIDLIAKLCKQNNALFHCDTVQTMGYFAHNVAETPVDFLVGAAHKFNGPKGVGFLFKRKNLKINALISGGAQERGLRGGTENIYGIVGMAKALELSYAHMAEKEVYIKKLQRYMMAQLLENVAGVAFNGDVEGSCHYTVLNVSLPPHRLGGSLLLNLGLVHNISASSGSACSAGSSIGSHVMAGIGADAARPVLRFSFGRQNTTQEIDYVVQKLKAFYA